MSNLIRFFLITMILFGCGKKNDHENLYKHWRLEKITFAPTVSSQVINITSSFEKTLAKFKEDKTDLIWRFDKLESKINFLKKGPEGLYRNSITRYDRIENETIINARIPFEMLFFNLQDAHSHSEMLPKADIKILEESPSHLKIKVTFDQALLDKIEEKKRDPQWHELYKSLEVTLEFTEYSQPL